jgi:hypothetical protein
MERRAIIKSEEERYVQGEVYIAWENDTHNTFMRPALLRKVAHNFIIRGLVNNVDLEHSGEPSGNVIAESFFVDCEGHPDGWAQNSWVVGGYIKNDADWEAVKSGRWNGWSMAGDGYFMSLLASVDHPIAMEGTTELHPAVSEPGVEPHFHSLSLQFDDSARLIPGISSIDQGHVHQVLKPTATEMAEGHAHRIVRS